MENNEKNDIIIKSLSEPMKEVLMDLANMSLNEVIKKFTEEPELLRDIPLIKWLFIAKDVISVFQSAFFLQKYSSFIGLIDESMKDDLFDDKKLMEIFSDKKVYSKVIDQTIISLDRYQTVQKAKLLGLLFVETFKNKNFSLKEYNTLVFSIENIHPFIGFDCLKSFYEYKSEMNKEYDKDMKDNIWLKTSNLDYSPLATTGLLRLPTGASFAGNLGGATINELGYRFYELVVSKI